MATIFLLATAANHAWYKPKNYWLHEPAACCYFGADLRNWLDHYSPSRSPDGTPHSSSDLLEFAPFVPFTFLEKIILSTISLPSSLPGLKILSRIPNSQKYSKSVLLSDLENFPLFAYPFHALAAGV